MQISIQKAFDRFAAAYAEAGGDSAGLFVQVRTDRDPLASRGARTYAVAGPDGDHPFGDSFRRAGDFLSALEFATDVLAHRPPSSSIVLSLSDRKLVTDAVDDAWAYRVGESDPNDEDGMEPIDTEFKRQHETLAERLGHVISG